MGDHGVISTPCEGVVRRATAIVRGSVDSSVGHHAVLQSVAAADVEVASCCQNCDEDEEEWEFGKHSKHVSLLVSRHMKGTYTQGNFPQRIPLTFF